MTSLNRKHRIGVMVGALALSLTLGSRPAVAQFENQLVTRADSGSFANSICLDGHHAMIGDAARQFAGIDVGCAYIYAYDQAAPGGPAWIEETELNCPRPGWYRHFGFSGALWDDVALVSAVFPAFESGVFLFRRMETGWVLELEIPSPVNIGDSFGYSVSLRKDLAVVSAPTANSGAGAVYIYRRVDGLWTEEAMLTVPDGARFGHSVALDGDRLVVGNPMSEGGVGSAYLFRKDLTEWVEEHRFSPTVGVGELPEFGTDVDLSWDRIIVGAPDEIVDFTGNLCAGVAYVFIDSAGWLLEQRLLPDAYGGFESFGAQVSLYHEVIGVGAPIASELGMNAGAAYVFRLSDAGWTRSLKLPARDVTDHANLGAAVAVGGPQEEHVLVGAPLQAAPVPPATGVLCAWDLHNLGPSWNNFGDGWPGTLGVPAFTASGDPALGANISLDLDSSLGEATTALILWGLHQAFVPTPVGGALQVEPRFVRLVSVPAPGWTQAWTIPADPALDGAEIFLQALLLDPGASHGTSFTRALRLYVADAP
jgi:hypothetical protein